MGIPLLALAGLGRPGRSGAAPLGPGGRVLAVKFSAVGDTLLLLPVLKALKRTVGPGGRLEVLATPVNAGILEGLGFLDRLHVVRPGDLAARPGRVLGLVGRLRGAGFDWALDFDQWLRAPALLAWASGARLRAGFRTPGQGKHRAFHRSLEHVAGIHEFEQFAALAALAGVDRDSVEPFQGFLMREGFLGAAPAGPGRVPLVALHPGAGGERAWQREWPVESYVALGARLRARGFRLALSGHGPAEEELCARIESGLGSPVEDRCVGRPFADLVGLLCRADALVCGNTGVMHLAAGLDRPLVALHGPTSVALWGPRRDLAAGARGFAPQAALPCSPCLTLGFEYGCAARPCMESFGVEGVEAAVLGVLERS